MTGDDLVGCLTVGLDVYLDPQPGVQNAPRFPGHIRGWEAGRYILLGVEPQAGGTVVRRGNQCIVRFMLDGDVWGFTSRAAESGAGADNSLIQLTWPQEVARIQVRKYERVVVKVPCEIHLSDDTTADGTIGDVSGGGCSMVSPVRLAVDDIIHLSFRMPEGVQVTRRPVRIRSRRPGGLNQFKYGCQFQEQKEADRNLELFVARKKATERGEAAPHPQLLVLSRSSEDIEIAQQALEASAYEIVAASGILDLGHRLHTCNAAGILISFEQRELSAIEVLSLIRQTEGMEEMPVFLYGGSEDMREKARSLGAAQCIATLAELDAVLACLPEIEPEPEPEPEESTTPEAASQESAGEAEKTGPTGDTVDADLEVSDGEDNVGDDEEDGDEEDEEISLA